MRYLLLALLLAACNMDTVMGPSPPPDEVISPPIEVDFDPGPSFDWSRVRGYSAFALTIHDEQTQVLVMNQAERRGYNTPRICAEVRDWPDTQYLPKGPDLDEALDRLEATVGLLARRGHYALVMPLCTIRDTASAQQRMTWVVSVAVRLAKYDNVAIEVVNEYWHPRSRVSRDDVRSYIKVFKRRGYLHVGADQNIGRFNGRYGYDRGLGSTFASFHPPRNPDPTRAQMEEIVKQNGGLAVLSETTCYGPGFGDLCTEDREQIQLYKTRCDSTPGCVFFYHSLEGLVADGFTWMAR